MAKKGGKYCVAGGPENVSCSNCSYTPGVSMHLFPKNEQTRRLWIRFVKRHRANFNPSSSSALCSAHFEPSCYSRLGLSAIIPEGQEYEEKRILQKGSIPTRDTAIEFVEPGPSSRDRRMSRNFLREISFERQAEKTSNVVLVQVASSSPVQGGDVTDLPSLPCSLIETATCSTVVSLDPDPSKYSAENSSQTEIDQTNQETQTTPEHCKNCERQKINMRRLQQQNSKLRLQKAGLKATIKELKRHTVDDASSQSDIVNEGQDQTDEDKVLLDDEEEVDDEMEDEEDDVAMEDDQDWASLERTDESEADNEENDGTSINDITVDKDTPCQNEPKFIVFYTRLLAIFSLFCFNCKEGKPEVAMKRNGTMVTVRQDCKNCGPKSFVWSSQPLVLGRYPAGNLLLSFGILMAGASVSKIILVFRHMGLSVYCARTFFVHQRKFLFPAILRHWETYRTALVNELKAVKDLVWSGDGRFDSMGHCAKYGVYTMLCCTIAKIVHFELVQANQVKSSGDMELKGAKDSFEFLKLAGLAIAVFVSDRHRSIAKWIRECQPNTRHFFDIWHIARSISKKMIQVGKESGCELITQWQKGVRNHLRWCATSTKIGFERLILAKWKSVMRHMCNKHTDHPDGLFKQCAHGTLSPRFWLKIGTKAYDKVYGILMNTRILNDIKKLSPLDQTSCLEGFHSTLNQFHPKMLCFSWLGTFCRHVLASLHFNENVIRETQIGRDGKDYIKVTYPKYKFGDEVVREISVPPTYKYVDDLRELVFAMPMAERTEITQKYKTKEPAALNTQFENRLSRADAVNKYQKRKEQETSLYPPAEGQDLLEAESTREPSGPTKKRKLPTCKKCGQPKRGHPKDHCSFDENS